MQDQTKNFNYFNKIVLIPLLFTLLFITGCWNNGPERSQQGFERAVAGFPAATHYGLQKLTPNQALQAALALNIADQGLNSWQDLAPALAASKKYVSRRPQDASALSDNGITITWRQIDASLSLMQKLLPRLNSRPELLVEKFTWYRVGPDVSFTGYYEPSIKASYVKTPQFSHPLYRMPPDVRKGQPYHNREAIDEKGVLQGRGLEIAWIEDKVDSFFLQVQGSGRLEFPDGSIKHVLYAGKNNCAYVSLGRVMKEKGLLEPDNVNMRSIRNYLKLHPQQVSALLCENPSYVFFRLADKGPVGAMGAVITPKVSLATDSNVLPMGSLLAFAVPLPGNNGQQGTGGLLAGIGLPQDRGGAIKGNRADLFCGAGPWAEHVAGHLDMPGAVFILIAK